MQLAGIHHLTAVTANAKANHGFFTQTLGMRLVKKTVNQDDVSAYHLFYADGKATPGTDITFFDWPAAPERRGTHSIVRTGLRVGSEASLSYWAKRFAEIGVTHSEIREIDGRASIDFEDAERQRLRLVAGGGVPNHPWYMSPVPAEHQIHGLGPITISVPEVKSTHRVLTDVLGMRLAREYSTGATDGNGGTAQIHVYEMGVGGPAAELHVAVEPTLRPASAGAGGVHHVAFRVPTYEEYDQWHDRLRQMRVASSGPIDRFYFRSLYFREPNGILFELATDGPGFDSDEPMDQLGQKLALPPFLEGRRAEIEAGLKPLEVNQKSA